MEKFEEDLIKKLKENPKNLYKQPNTDTDTTCSERASRLSICINSTTSTKITKCYGAKYADDTDNTCTCSCSERACRLSTLTLLAAKGHAA